MCHIETNAEVFNHVEVAASTHGLHTNFGDLPGIVHELVFCHTNARIVDRDGRIGLVRNGLNEVFGWASILSGSVIDSVWSSTPESRVCQKHGGDVRCTHHGREIQLKLHMKSC